MPINCVIKFDNNPYGLYHAGQVLSGRVEINLDKPKKVKGVCLKISGFAQCKWSETNSTGVGKNRRSRTVWYIGREDYLSSQTYFVGSDEGNQLELTPGLHTYNFSCALPLVIPTSFEGTHGHIRYTARVILERPWKFDQTYKVAFTVLKPLDLNFESPVLRIPSKMETNQMFGCGPCKSGPFSLVASIPQSGYVSGQEIKIHVDLANQSKVTVYEIKFILKKIIQYYSQTPQQKSKTETLTIQERKIRLPVKIEQRSYDASLLIPPVPPTNYLFCKVIHISYEVKVTAKVSGMNSNPKIVMPVVIGTIPLRQIAPGNPPIEWGGGPPMGIGFAAMYPGQPSGSGFQVAAPTAPFEVETPPITTQPMSRAGDNVFMSETSGSQDPPAFMDLPPPTYEESMFGNRQIEDEDDQHPMGHQLYTPRYPVYHFTGSESIQNTNVNTNTNPNPNSNPNTNINIEGNELHSEKLRENISNWN